MVASKLDGRNIELFIWLSGFEVDNIGIFLHIAVANLPVR